MDGNASGRRSQTAKRVSLVLELSGLEHALAALGRLLVAATEATSSPRDAAEQAWEAAAVALLLRQRVELLRGAAQSDLDPKLLACPENDPGDLGDDVQDVLLTAWSPQQCAAHAQRELDRAEAQVAAAAPPRRTAKARARR